MISPRAFVPFVQVHSCNLAIISASKAAHPPTTHLVSAYCQFRGRLKSATATKSKLRETSERSVISTKHSSMPHVGLAFIISFILSTILFLCVARPRSAIAEQVPQETYARVSECEVVVKSKHAKQLLHARSQKEAVFFILRVSPENRENAFVVAEEPSSSSFAQGIQSIHKRSFGFLAATLVAVLIGAIPFGFMSSILFVTGFFLVTSICVPYSLPSASYLPASKLKWWHMFPFDSSTDAINCKYITLLIQSPPYTTMIVPFVSMSYTRALSL